MSTNRNWIYPLSILLLNAIGLFKTIINIKFQYLLYDKKKINFALVKYKKPFNIKIEVDT